MQCAWNVQTEETPVTVGPDITISDSFRKYLISLPGKHDVKDLQKNSHTGHCTRTSGSTDVQLQNFYYGE